MASPCDGGAGRVGPPERDRIQPQLEWNIGGRLVVQSPWWYRFGPPALLRRPWIRGRTAVFLRRCFIAGREGYNRSVRWRGGSSRPDHQVPSSAGTPTGR